jgi:hypothetical protein
MSISLIATNFALFWTLLSNFRVSSWHELLAREPSSRGLLGKEVVKPRAMQIGTDDKFAPTQGPPSPRLYPTRASRTHHLCSVQHSESTHNFPRDQRF